MTLTKKLDKLEAPAWQVGIQFFQVGREPGAREHLKQLDDGLAELAGDDELRDIVDTVPFTGADNEELTGAGVLKVVLGSVNRRLDRNSRELHRRKPQRRTKKSWRRLRIWMQTQVQQYISHTILLD